MRSACLIVESLCAITSAVLPLVMLARLACISRSVSVSRRAFLKQGRKAVPSSKSKGPSTDGKRERSYIGLGTENFQ